MLTTKDLVRINREIGERGEVHNESSLDFALSSGKHKKSWLYELSYLLRSLLVDHAFRDGNKRTALAITIVYFDDRSLEWDKERLVRAIHEVSKKNYKSIEQIARSINNAIIP